MLPGHLANTVMSLAIISNLCWAASMSGSPTPSPSEAAKRQVEVPGFIELRRDCLRRKLNRLKSCSPQFFKHLVPDLLVAMGHRGNSRKDSGEAVGKSDDGRTRFISTYNSLKAYEQQSPTSWHRLIRLNLLGILHLGVQRLSSGFLPQSNYVGSLW
jgi:hypothetical protein